MDDLVYQRKYLKSTGKAGNRIRDLWDESETGNLSTKRTGKYGQLCSVK